MAPRTRPPGGPGRADDQPAARAEHRPRRRALADGGTTGDGDRDGSTATRRQTLAATGGALAVGAGGYAGWQVASHTAPRADQAGGSDPGDGNGNREDFVWLGAGTWQDRRLRENLFAFAARHGLAVALGQPPASGPDVASVIEPVLADAQSFGVEPWFNVGVLRELTAGQFRRDDAARERHLAGLRAVAAAYRERFDGGRLILWQEAPVMGAWSPSGKWNQRTVERLRADGPAIFAAQQAAIEAENPALDVGIFPHFPYVVDSKQPEVFRELAGALRYRGATPDFAFTDFYRGWYEKDAGPEVADAAVRSLIGNARDALGGAPVFNIGQAHTINPGHTPSGESLRSNLRAARTAGAAGIGWYLSSSATPTTRGFDPFVPNAADAEYAEDLVTTATVARDRYLRAWMPTLAAQSRVDPADRFDLWLRADALAFYAHRVRARTADGEWALLGDAGGYVDWEYPHAGVPTAVFRALPRERFLADGTLTLRIDTRNDADPATLRDVVAMPWDPAAFLTEREADSLLARERALDPFALGRASPDARLTPGASTRVRLAVADGTRSLAPLAWPAHADVVERLRRAERRDGFDPGGRFDLWLAGADLADAAPTVRGPDGGRLDPAAESVASVTADGAAVYYGLDRERHLPDALQVVDAGGARVDALAAMPYATAACVRSPAAAAALLAEQPDEINVFALASAGLPAGSGHSSS
ncbi:MAG: hypothetical protein ABEJ31_11900 [Haloarculaceae archaeon]